MNRVASEWDRELAIKADQEVVKFLSAWYYSDRVGFEKRFANVDLTGEAARRSATDLLSCFLGLHRCGLMKCVTPAYLQIYQDIVDGYALDYPMGRVFEFHHFGRRERWWDGFLRARPTSLMVSLQDLKSVHGDLHELVMVFENYSAMFTARSLKVRGSVAVQVRQSGTHIGCDAQTAAVREELAFFERLHGADASRAD